ncbi:zinc finger protein indra [Drosophila kikkawai]|uniref:Zinc finger protein indra n=1 Tax=Drosophila kikkawai TaxID=30033 RepID=A0A6P4IMU6_DROKI|nr:zinc finger protein CG2199 [Drosophila kikkawai]
MTKQVICDYCGSSNESKTIFSAQKSFVGYKMLEVLQIITHKDLPANLAVKVCFMCASNLMTTMGVIEKTVKLVDNASLIKGAAAANKNKKAVEELDKSNVDPIVDLTAEGEAKTAKPKTTPAGKNLTIRQRSKSMASRPSDLIFPKSPAQKLDELNASSSKQTPKKHTSRLEDGLDDSVRLTPAKEVAPNKKVFLQLFGSRNANDAAAPESEDEDEDENAADENAGKVITIKKSFDCKLCDFQSRSAKPFKQHLSQEHGQQRPRIYFCDLCPKSFGVLKSWRVHNETAHGVTVEAPQKEVKEKVAKPKKQPAKADSKEDKVKPIEKSPRKEKTNKGKELSPRKEKSNKANEMKSPRKEKSNKVNEINKVNEVINDEEISEGPQLATIRALNGETSARNKWLEKVINNPDYTFDVNGSSASTPKAADISMELGSEFKCDICDSELTTAKQMQEHMQTAHGIDKPKIFKCTVCEKSLSSKQSLKYHMNLHSNGSGGGAEEVKSSKRKILQEEEKEVDIVDGNADKSPDPEDDDEQPTEEKILHTDEAEAEVQEIAIKTEDENDLMAPPKPVGKKPKKAKDSTAVISITDSPSKKGKRKNKEEASLNETTTTVDLLEEINTNVKPHKKARLESISDSFASSIEDYSTAEESVLSCGQCGKQVKSKQRLALHIRKRHGTKLECPGCKSSYHNQRDYVNHFAVCSAGGSLLPCGVENCKKSFYEANYLSSHLRLKHQWV